MSMEKSDFYRDIVKQKSDSYRDGFLADLSVDRLVFTALIEE